MELSIIFTILSYKHVYIRTFTDTYTLTDTLLTLGEGPGEGSSTLCCSLSLTVGSSWRYNTNLSLCVKQTQKELVFAGLDQRKLKKVDKFKGALGNYFNLITV